MQPDAARSAASGREVAVGGDGKTPIIDAVTGEPIRVPADACALDVEALPRRVAHAVHALLAVRDDSNIGPYGPFKASEVVLYDGEALTARHTAAALREAEKRGLAINIRGYWTAGRAALDNARAFEDRYMRETADGF